MALLIGFHALHVEPSFEHRIIFVMDDVVIVGFVDDFSTLVTQKFARHKLFLLR
jgi:hypothetical protein